MEIELNFFVSYSQFSVFICSLRHPFNLWTTQHVNQGFSWRPGSVSFGTLVDGGPFSLEIKVVDRVSEVDDEAIRVLEVPFEVPSDGTTCIGASLEEYSLQLHPGRYLLRCELFEPAQDDAQRGRLTFTLNEEPHFAIVRADPGLSPGLELQKNAEAAGSDD